MKFSVFTFIFIFFAGSLLAFPKDDKKKEALPGTSGMIEGVVYALPQTGIRLHVKATRERYVHGPFSIYAQKMLGIDNVSSADADRWNLDEMHIELFSEPDPEEVHKAIGQAAQMVSLTESGILAGINSEVSYQEPSIQTSSFLMKSTDNQLRFNDLSIWSFYSPIDSTKKFKIVSKTQEQKAIEAAETIFNLRNSRFALLTNANDEPLPDGKSFEVMTEELKKMEENYVSLFIGKSTKQICEFSFDFVPGQKTVKGEVFFRFSEERGVLPKSDLSGRPIVIDVIKSENLNVKQSGLSASENPNAGKNGLFYRMPGMSEIRIMDGSSQLAGARTPIAQFGTVAPIPEDLLDGSYILEFYPTTGAVKSILENTLKKSTESK
jgi:hypothetical protein